MVPVGGGSGKFFFNPVKVLKNVRDRDLVQFFGAEEGFKLLNVIAGNLGAGFLFGVELPVKVGHF